MSARTIARIEAWTWALIYGGLFGVVLGLAARRVDPVTAWLLMAAGAVIAVLGAVLIFVRSRMAPPPPGAQSDA